MRVLIIGLGSIAKKHIKALYRLYEDCKVFALRSGNGADRVVGVTNIYSFDEAKSIQPDFIIISNPTFQHLKTIETVLEWGFPLFIEKPILHSLEDAYSLSAKLDSTSTLNYVACNLRFLDSLQFVSNKLKNQNKLNEVNIYAGSYLPEWRPGIDFRKSYSSNRAMGGGVHLDIIHELDYVYWFFGKPLHVRSLLKSQSSLNINAIDYANYQLLYGGFVVNVVLNYYRRDYKRTAEFVFEDKTWTVDLPSNKIASHTGELVFKSDQSIMDTYFVQMKYFLQLVENKSKKSFNSAKDGLEVLKICLNEQS